jgi:hypothetical protein
MRGKAVKYYRLFLHEKFIERQEGLRGYAPAPIGRFGCQE